jgi:diguanylate cyclase (GGDEF)-like protein/PAS domain S-box-containing protein
MLRVLTCLGYEHEYRLVLLAAIVCVAGSWIAMRLFSRTRASTGSTRVGWLFLTGVATGASIWTTHFIAMLAFEPSLPTSYEPALTLASLFIAIAATTLGFAVAASRAVAWSGIPGGALVGFGIGAMHYTGMAAFRVAGSIEWDTALVVASVIIGAVFGALALDRIVRTDAARSKYLAAGLLTLAICGLHFTAMGAVAIVPDPSIVIPARTMSSEALSLSVAGVALLVMGTGLTSYLIDQRASNESRGRIRHLADASLDGIVITDGSRIRYANGRFEELSGHAREALHGQGLFEGLLEWDAGYLGGDHDHFECKIRTASGELVPVEVTASATTSGEYRKVYAFRDLRERLESEKRIRHLADHDPLTGLANRTAFNERLDRDLNEAAPARGRLAVLCMNLNRFQEINDVFGHGMGDRALVEAARRMRAALREDEFLARLGGDEFAAIQLAQSEPEHAADLARRLIGALAARMTIGGQSVQLAISAGIALYPADGEDREQLLANAAVAMYRAKADTQAAFCFFKREMDESVRHRRALSQELEFAIERGELELHYQVQKSVKSDDICGFEALLRWRHPSRGIIAPVEFVPLAEETGLIIPIGEWVLRTACRTAAAWDRPYKIAVNLSPIQFSHANLSALVQASCLKPACRRRGSSWRSPNRR